MYAWFGVDQATKSVVNLIVSKAGQPFPDIFRYEASEYSLNKALPLQSYVEKSLIGGWVKDVLFIVKASHPVEVWL